MDTTIMSKVKLGSPRFILRFWFWEVDSTTMFICSSLNLVQVRSDLPGYLADSEADGVCVIK